MSPGSDGRPGDGPGPGDGMGPGSQMMGQRPPYEGLLVNGRLPSDPAVFEVEEGERVRLRFINPSSATTYRVGVGGHSLTVTHADGRPVEPVEVDSFVMSMGERYDAILEADAPASGPSSPNPSSAKRTPRRRDCGTQTTRRRRLCRPAAVRRRRTRVRRSRGARAAGSRRGAGSNVRPHAVGRDDGQRRRRRVDHRRRDVSRRRPVRDQRGRPRPRADGEPQPGDPPDAPPRPLLSGRRRGQGHRPHRPAAIR